jgi:hypothetical protein
MDTGQEQFVRRRQYQCIDTRHVSPNSAFPEVSQVDRVRVWFGNEVAVEFHFKLPARSIEGAQMVIGLGPRRRHGILMPTLASKTKLT